MSIGVRHKVHPFPILVTYTVSAHVHVEQKRAWPHGTNTTPVGTVDFAHFGRR